MLRKKTLLGVGATLIILILVLYVVTRQIILREFTDLEQQLIARNLNRVTSILADDKSSLQATITDWSEWDDTYDYMESRSQDYLTNNISNDLYKTYRINLILYVDMSGNVAYSGGNDAPDARSLDLIHALKAKLQQDAAFRAAILPPDNLPPSPPGQSFVVRTTYGPLLLGVGPILDSFGKGTPRGTLIWGRYLGAQESQRLSKLTSLPVSFIPLSDKGTTSDQRLTNVTLSASTPNAIVASSETITHGFNLVTDLTGAPAFVFDVTVPRDVYQRGQLLLGYLVFALVVAGVVMGALILVMMDRLVLARLAGLNREVLQIGQQDDLSLRVAATGSDELANFGRTINTTLDALAHSRAELTSLNADLEARVAARTSELQARQNFLQAILDTMKEGVLFGSPNAIYSVNDVITDMCGHPSEALIGRPSYAIFDETLTSLVQGVNTADHGEGWLLCADGSRLAISVTVSPQVELDGQVGTIYVVRDISEEKALQARKDRFLADASHELRNPLTNLMTRLYMVRKQPERLDAHLEILDGVVNQMRTLVEDLLDSTRFTQGSTPLKREVTPLQGLVETVVEQQRPEAELKQLTLTCTLPDEPIYASVDTKRMTQVITNLLTNAIHYTHSGGSISIELAPGSADEPRSAVLAVRDSGIGISAEHLPQLFMPFFRINSDTPGTGLGLAIVKEIVDRHDGQINVESALGQGTTFTLTLATVPAPQNAAVV